jgi:hypothetical protein
MFTHVISVNILMFLLSSTISTLNLFEVAANSTHEGICESHVTHLMKLKKIKKRDSKKKFIFSTDYIQQILAEHLVS